MTKTRALAPAVLPAFQKDQGPDNLICLSLDGTRIRSLAKLALPLAPARGQGARDGDELLPELRRGRTIICIDWMQMRGATCCYEIRYIAIDDLYTRLSNQREPSPASFPLVPFTNPKTLLVSLMAVLFGRAERVPILDAAGLGSLGGGAAGGVRVVCGRQRKKKGGKGPKGVRMFTQP
jgi:hypothetical protein